MTTLIRRNCPCGAVWYAHVGEPFTDQCKECFLNEAKERRQVMTTQQIANNEFDQTTPDELKEEASAAPEATNDHAEAPKTATRKRPGRVRAVATNGERVSHETELPAVLDSTDPLDGIEERLDLLDAEEQKALDRIDRIRALRGRLASQNVQSKRYVAAAEELIERNKARRDAKESAATRPRKASSTKRHRRSNEEIQTGVEAVVALVKKNKEGLRAEQIRKVLDFDKKEMPMILKTALAAEQLKTKGQKRATTYFAR